MNFFGYIPKNVRHDSSLSPRDKLVYSEITATLNDDGICIKNNIHFSNVLQCTKATISASMTSLRESGHISVIIEKDDTSQKFVKRYILLQPISNFLGGVDSELQKAMSNIFGGVSAKNDSTGSFNATPPSKKLDAIIINNNIRYISNSFKRNQINLIRGINQKQLAFLQKIVVDFYTSKRKQFPIHINEEWHKDTSLLNDSINTLFQLITLDNWKETDVRDVIIWATDDKFWTSNLMSLRVLRKKSNNGLTKFANLHLKYKG